MFKSIMQQQGEALESMMAKQPAKNPHLMDEARADLQSAISKAIKASENLPSGKAS